MRRNLTRTASIPTCQSSGNKSIGFILSVLPAATCGSTLTTCPLRPETPCGKGVGESWPFRLLDRGGTEDVPQSLPPLAEASGNEVEKPTNRVPYFCSNALLLKLRIDKPRLPNR